MKIKHFAALFMAVVAALAGWSCDTDIQITHTPVPTIGIMEPEFDAKSMKVSVMIAPSTDAEAWYWMVEGGVIVPDVAPSYNKEEGAAAKEISFSV